MLSAQNLLACHLRASLEHRAHIVEPCDSTSPSTAVRRHSLAVYESGDPTAPTVVAVHGYPDNHTVWDGVAALLARALPRRHLRRARRRRVGQARRARSAYRMDAARRRLRGRPRRGQPRRARCTCSRTTGARSSPGRRSTDAAARGPHRVVHLDLRPVARPRRRVAAHSCTGTRVAAAAPARPLVLHRRCSSCRRCPSSPPGTASSTRGARARRDRTRSVAAVAGDPTRARADKVNGL